jgi:uncharacterized membrane protein YebE (DUF533 family)
MAGETSVKSFLDSLLRGGKSLIQKGEDLAAEKLGVDDDPESRAEMRNTALAGGAGAALLGLLVGTRGGRSVAKTGVVLGGLGMLGKLAYDAYKRVVPGAATPDAPLADQLEGPAGERRAIALASAMIAAAKADGHIDDAERTQIDTHLAALPENLRNLLTTEMDAPLDATALAAKADSDQARREMFAVSVLVSGDENPTEQAYLDALASALGLDAQVVQSILDDIRAG